jgi:hypothetical protein
MHSQIPPVKVCLAFIQDLKAYRFNFSPPRMARSIACRAWPESAIVTVPAND